MKTTQVQWTIYFRRNAEKIELISRLQKEVIKFLICGRCHFRLEKQNSYVNTKGKQDLIAIWQN
jgi:hypothetical protein